MSSQYATWSTSETVASTQLQLQSVFVCLAEILTHDIVMLMQPLYREAAVTTLIKLSGYATWSRSETVASVQLPLISTFLCLVEVRKSRDFVTSMQPLYTVEVVTFKFTKISTMGLCISCTV